MQTNLTRNETNAMRGIAIIGIFLHNFLHWLQPMLKENEYMFHVDRVRSMWHTMLNPNADFVLQMLSFFGHYGVPVFLFLSAYGLERKYSGNKTTQILPFIGTHFVKLFRLMVVGFVLFLIVDTLLPHSHNYFIKDILSQLTLTINLIPTLYTHVWPGPYWFFGLMMQLYIIYILFIYRRHWGITVGLMIAFTIVQMAFPPTSYILRYLRYNAIGSMLPFGLGVIYARFMPENVSGKTAVAVFLISILGMIFGSLNYYSWYVVPVFVCAATVTFVKFMPSAIVKCLEWMGGISAALFVMHPIARKLFISLSRNGDIYTGLTLYILTAMVLALLYRKLLNTKWYN